MREFIKPDWNNCNINISSTLAEFLGVPNKNSTLVLSRFYFINMGQQSHFKKLYFSSIILHFIQFTWILGISTLS